MALFTHSRPYITTIVTPWPYHLIPGSTSCTFSHHASGQVLPYQNKTPSWMTRFFERRSKSTLPHLAFGPPYHHQHSPSTTFSICFINLTHETNQWASHPQQKNSFTSSVSEQFHVLWHPSLCFVQTNPHYFILLVSVQRSQTMPFATSPSYFTFSPMAAVPHLPWSKYFIPPMHAPLRQSYLIHTHLGSPTDSSDFSL